MMTVAAFVSKGLNAKKKKSVWNSVDDFLQAFILIKSEGVCLGSKSKISQGLPDFKVQVL